MAPVLPPKPGASSDPPADHPSTSGAMTVYEKAPHIVSASPDHQTTGGAMTVEEFCRWGCVGKTKAYAEAKAGRLQLRKIGTKTVILRSDAEAWLRALPAASSAAA
jgi:hypothetical protein